MLGQRKPRVFYGWVIVAVSFLTVAIAGLARSFYSIVLIPIQESFDCTRAEASLPFCVSMLMFSLIAPVIGGMLDGCIIAHNEQYGAQDVTSMNRSNIYGNAEYDYFETRTDAEATDVTDNYWGEETAQEMVEVGSNGHPIRLYPERSNRFYWLGIFA